MACIAVKSRTKSNAYRQKKTCAITTTYSASGVRCQTPPKAHNYAAHFGTVKRDKKCQGAKNHAVKGILFNSLMYLLHMQIRL